MGLNNGESVTYSVMPEITKYPATVVSVDNETIILKTETDNVQDVQKGKYVIVSGSGSRYYTEAVSLKENILTLRHVWEEKRSYFRVDDTFPVEVRKIRDDIPHRKSKIFRGYDVEKADIELPDENINPKLWQLLVDINTKLTMILDRLRFESEGFKRGEEKLVNLSASGMRFTMNEKVMPGDKLEIKMLLPTGYPVGIVTYGNVVRTNDIGDGLYEVSVHFSDMDEEVREEIIRYAINRQRELIRKERQK